MTEQPGVGNAMRVDKGDPGEERVAYVVPRSVIRPADDEITFLDVWRIIWDGKWIGILLTGAVAVLSVVYALAATEWYRADVLLVPADERNVQGLPGQLGGLGGLASLAGLSATGRGATEALAVLRSRHFLSEFIEQHDLMPVLLAELWDPERGEWLPTPDGRIPDSRDAVEYFRENILNVNEDTRTGLTTVTVEWMDPEVAAGWANSIVAALNERMRQRALVEAETNVRYLQDQLASTSLVALQQSIGRLLENEMQKLMLAKGNEEFAFRILDPAEVPTRRARPFRTLIVLGSTLAAGLVSFFLILMLHMLRGRAQS